MGPPGSSGSSGPRGPPGRPGEKGGQGEPGSFEFLMMMMADVRHDIEALKDRSDAKQNN